MYLSAIVIFGKEISPWWIAGGVGTGVVVAGVIIYMRNHKDDDPNFKIPKIKNEPIIRKPVIEKKSGIDAPQDVLQAPDGNVKPIIKKPVIAEAVAEPEVPITPIVPEVPIIALRKAVTEQAPSPVEAQVISKLEYLKANKIALEKVKLIEELNLAKISKIIKHKDLKISEVNAVIAETKADFQTILKMGGNPVMDANFLEETREYREYLDRMKEDLLKNKEDWLKEKLDSEVHLSNIKKDLTIVNNAVEEMEAISLVSHFSNMLVYGPIICLNIYQIYQATNAIMVISIIAKGVTNMCMFKIFLICLKAIIIGSPIWILVGTIVYKIIKYMNS